MATGHLIFLSKKKKRKWISCAFASLFIFHLLYQFLGFTPPPPVPPPTMRFTCRISALSKINTSGGILSRSFQISHHFLFSECCLVTWSHPLPPRPQFSSFIRLCIAGEQGPLYLPRYLAYGKCLICICWIGALRLVAYTLFLPAKLQFLWRQKPCPSQSLSLRSQNSAHASEES